MKKLSSLKQGKLTRYKKYLRAMRSMDQITWCVKDIILEIETQQARNEELLQFLRKEVKKFQ